jgi:beta-glucanase (GH16 family)
VLALVVIASTAGGAQLVWSDEFDLTEGSGPDATKWTYDLGAGGWGNQELQTYTDSRANSFIVADPVASDGKALAIRAVRSQSGQYTSARIKTQGRFTTTHGRIEARIKLTRGQGIWPAFWALGANIGTVGWPACGEIDVMEQVGHEPDKIYGSVHSTGFETNSSTTFPAGVSSSSGYHVYAVVWTEGRIEWFLDGVSYGVKTTADVPTGGQWPFENPFFLLLNVAVGGDWPGSPDGTTEFPQTMLVDYVRVYTTGPETPRYVGAVADGAGAVTLTWTQPGTTGAPVLGHVVERAEDGAFSVGYVRAESGPEAFVVDDTGEPGTGYFYRVAVETEEGRSSFSSPAYVLVPGGGGSGSANGSLVNCSTRAVVGAGDLAIVGFVITERPRRVLVRAAGPALREFGVSDALSDPLLTLRDADGRILATNDNWHDRPDAAEIVSSSETIGAFVFSDESKDAAILLALAPGSYTAVIEAQNGHRGVVLAEIYEVP